MKFEYSINTLEREISQLEDWNREAEQRLKNEPNSEYCPSWRIGIESNKDSIIELLSTIQFLKELTYL